MQESTLYQLWTEYALSRTILQSGNDKLIVLDAGRPHFKQGPDFVSARFNLNGITYQGAVEMHVKLEEWYKHQHHYDPAFKDVVLHVLAKKPKHNQHTTHHLNPFSIPHFVLPQKQEGRALCKQKESAQLQEMLSQLALRRLKRRVQVFNKQLGALSFPQLLYQKIFRSMGYPANNLLFEWLAMRCTKQSNISYHEYLAKLMGQAGFLEGGYKSSYARNLQTTFYNNPTQPQQLNKQMWQRAAVRYHNHPHFRLAGLAALFNRWQPQQMYTYFINSFMQRLPFKELNKELHTIFNIPVYGYWQKHYALDKPLHKKQNQQFFAKNRLLEIMINVLIPIAYLDATIKGSSSYLHYITEFYLWLKGPVHYSFIKQSLPWLIEPLKEYNRFAYGQAVIELNTHFCKKQRCAQCKIGHIYKL